MKTKIMTSLKSDSKNTEISNAHSLKPNSQPIPDISDSAKTGKAIRIQVGIKSAPKDTNIISNSETTNTNNIAHPNKTLAEISALKFKRKRLPKDPQKTGKVSDQTLDVNTEPVNKNNVKVKENFKGPQVELVKGNIVVKESSLTVVPETSIEDYEEIVEGLHPTAKYSSFSDKIYSPTWGIEETRLFYDALRQCGTDFTLMQAFFPTRTRKQIKFKFFREELQHPELIKAALNYGLPLDIAPFEVHLGQFSEFKSDEQTDTLPETTISKTSKKSKKVKNNSISSSRSSKDDSVRTVSLPQIDIDDNDLINV